MRATSGMQEQDSGLLKVSLSTAGYSKRTLFSGYTAWLAAGSLCSVLRPLRAASLGGHEKVV